MPLQDITWSSCMLHSVSYKYLKPFLVICNRPNHNLNIGPVIFFNIIKSQLLTNSGILVDKTAAANSNLGIDVYFIGATHDFAITKLQ